jgi:hypothetical protein
LDVSSLVFRFGAPFPELGRLPEPEDFGFEITKEMLVLFIRQGTFIEFCEDMSDRP